MASSDNRIESLTKNIQTLTFLVIFLVVAVGFLFVKDFLGKSGSVANNATLQAPQQPETTSKVTLNQIKKLFTKGNIYFGDKNRKNLFVMFSDPSCPYCHIASGKNPELNEQAGSQFVLTANGGSYVAPLVEMKELVDEGKAGFVWLYQNGHGNGEMGTKALYCAYDQGKFWEAHDLLMSNSGYSLLNDEVKNDKTKIPELVDFLSSVVNTGKLEECLKSGKYDQKITQDMTTAATFGVNGTPGFFVNTANFAGAYSWQEMQSALN